MAYPTYVLGYYLAAPPGLERDYGLLDLVVLRVRAQQEKGDRGG